MKIEYDYEYYWETIPERIEYTAQGIIYHNSPLHLGPQEISRHQTEMKILPDPDEERLYMLYQGSSRYEVIRVKEVLHDNVCRVVRGELGTAPLSFLAFTTLYPVNITRITKTPQLVRTSG